MQRQLGKGEWKKKIKVKKDKETKKGKYEIGTNPFDADFDLFMKEVGREESQKGETR